MPTDDSDDTDLLGLARPLLATAVLLGARAAAAGDHAGSYALYARFARKIPGLGEIADFRLDHALEEAEVETDPVAQAKILG